MGHRQFGLCDLSIIILVFLLFSCDHKAHSQLNLDFEEIIDGKPRDWVSIGSPDFFVTIDSMEVYSKMYSVKIESSTQAEQKFKGILRMLPNSYDGNELTVSAYIRTEDVIDGFAGIMIRLDPGVALNAMETQGVTGTTEWRKYEISLPLRPLETTSIAIGGYLAGSGTAWFDDFEISVDGKSIGNLQDEFWPADLDVRFDDGSAPEMQHTDDRSLAVLGHVWGFLKYYHPSIALGKLNWDYELLEFLPTYTEAVSKSEREQLLLEWVEQLGTEVA